MNFNENFVVTATNINTNNEEKDVAYEDSFYTVCKINKMEQLLYFAKRLGSFEKVLEKIMENGHDMYCINVFREGIKPEWEDKHNINGCSYIVTLKHGDATNYIFENLLFNFLQNNFSIVNVNGIRVDIKKSFVKISIWVKEIPDSKNNAELFHELSANMGFDSNVSFMLKRHQKMVEQLTNVSVNND